MVLWQVRCLWTSPFYQCVYYFFPQNVDLIPDEVIEPTCDSIQVPENFRVKGCTFKCITVCWDLIENETIGLEHGCFTKAYTYQVEFDGVIQRPAKQTEFIAVPLAPYITHKFRACTKDGCAVSRWSNFITMDIKSSFDNFTW